MAGVVERCETPKIDIPPAMTPIGPQMVDQRLPGSRNT